MAQFDIVIFQKNASNVWEQITLVPAVNDFLGVNGAKVLVSKAVGSATPTAHASTHATNGSDPLAWSSAINNVGVIAARPAASAANNGYFYLATDVNGGTMYRSNGATWVQIGKGVTEAPGAHASTHLAGGTDALSWTAILGRDILANRPAAGATNSGYLYFATDVAGGTWYQSDGATWNANSIGLTTITTVARGGTGVGSLTGFVFGNGASAMTAVLANLTAVVDPTVNEDSGDGYGVGSVWVNTATNDIFFATDVAVGAAVWRKVQAPTVDTVTITSVTTTTYNVLTTDRVVESNLAAPGAVGLFLPDLASLSAGQVVSFVDGTGDAGTNTITITAFGAQTINGVATYTITNNYGSITLYKSSATRWRTLY